MITGHTTVIAHIGYPTHSFKSPVIYNPWFEAKGVDAVVVPMGVKAEEFEAFLPLVTRMSNFGGALITMPHKVTTMALVDESTPTAKIAGAANAVKVDADGRLLGDQFDGMGFVNGALTKGCRFEGRSALVVGSGGVGSAIAASIAGTGVARLGVFDARQESAQGLAARITEHYPGMDVASDSNDPAGYDIVVNATPMGMEPGDPMPVDTDRIERGAFVGEVVMKQAITPFLQAALDRGCTVQVGTDMLFAQIPSYLSYFGLGETTAEELRSLAKLPG
ncbi:MAG: shikimate dehydrogenase family protein [Actinomycetales bacterium]